MRACGAGSQADGLRAERDEAIVVVGGLVGQGDMQRHWVLEPEGKRNVALHQSARQPVCWGRAFAGERELSAETVIRPFQEGDATQLRALFIAVNRGLAPPHMRDAFEAYIARSLAEEMDRVAAYYGERFWVAVREEVIVGMFGLEPAGPDVMELRRMYVDPTVRRTGIGRRMLGFAEDECRRLGMRMLELSTSEAAAGGAGTVPAIGISPGAGGGGDAKQ